MQILSNLVHNSKLDVLDTLIAHYLARLPTFFANLYAHDSTQGMGYETVFG
jgi:hypothetical protein